VGDDSELIAWLTGRSAKELFFLLLRIVHSDCMATALNALNVSPTTTSDVFKVEASI
jgi:hypothetical protein